jgi:ribosomal protein S10
MRNFYQIKITTSFFSNLLFVDTLLPLCAGSDLVIKKIILPKKIKKFVVIKSPHVNSSSKEHFKVVKYCRLFFVHMSATSLQHFLKKTPNSLDILIKKINLG